LVGCLANCRLQRPPALQVRGRVRGRQHDHRQPNGVWGGGWGGQCWRRHLGSVTVSIAHAVLYSVLIGTRPSMPEVMKMKHGSCSSRPFLICPGANQIITDPALLIPWESGSRVKLPQVAVHVQSVASIQNLHLDGGPSSVYCPQVCVEGLPMAARCMFPIWNVGEHRGVDLLSMRGVSRDGVISTATPRAALAPQPRPLCWRC
jgi:hypothetical protein